MRGFVTAKEQNLVRNQTGPKEARAGPVTRNCPRPSSRAHGRTPGLPTTGRSRYDRQASPPSLPPSAACTTFSPLATRSSPHLTALLAAWRVRRVRPSRSRRQLFRSGRSRPPFPAPFQSSDPSSSGGVTLTTGNYNLYSILLTFLMPVL
jgi:hypothetical protein